MTNQFHRALNRMAFFTALLLAGLILFYEPFLRVASANILLNGIIIGTTIFGIGLCFVEMFKLLPEYKWARAYFSGRKNAPLPPRLLRPVALILRARPVRISATTLNGMLDMILLRFEDSRESVRYITNTLIFLGLLETMRNGLTGPLSGMATAFTSSLMGLAGSLMVGFLGLQVQLAQNGIFRELEDYLSAHTSVATTDTVATVLPQISNATNELNKSVQELKQTFSELAQ